VRPRVLLALGVFALVVAAVVALSFGWRPWIPAPDLPANAGAREVALDWAGHVSRGEDSAASALMLRPRLFGSPDSHLVGAARVEISAPYAAHEASDQSGVLARYRSEGIASFTQVEVSVTGGRSNGTSEFLLLGQQDRTGRWLVLTPGSSPF
jgi:hypothetical protein